MFLEHFRINIIHKSSITDEVVRDFVSKLRVVISTIHYTIPSEELVKLLNQICIRHIANTLKI